MSYVQRPCACGGTTFQVLPSVHLHHGTYANTVYTWMVTAVVCTQCTRTEMFTSNADQIATHVQGARVITAGQS